MDYEEAGVDINQEEKAIKALTKEAFFSRKKNFKKIDVDNHYAGIMELGRKKLAMSIDGVGTKLLVAKEMNEYEGLGIDCIAMNANDIISVGAEPIGFVDYLAFEDPNKEISKQIGKGLKKGAQRANMNLLGGETATLTEIINDFDLAGSCIGITDKLVLGNEIKTDDKIIGLKSNGIHSNGLTLARESIKKSNYDYQDEFDDEKTIGEELLKPTKLYVKPVLKLLENYEIHGLAHITGGGLRNLMRLGEYKYKINHPLEPQEIFNFLKEIGDISLREMYKVFNMGIGYCLITPESETEEIIEDLKKMDFDSQVVGEIKKGSSVEITIKGDKIVL